MNHGSSSSSHWSRSPQALRSFASSSASPPVSAVVSGPADPVGAVRAAFDKITARLSDDSPSALQTEKLGQRYPTWRAWPADGRLGLILLGWALGSGFALAGFREAASEHDFEAMAGVVPTGVTPAFVSLFGIARVCFRNAAHVVKWDLKDEVLYWPWDLASCAGADWPKKLEVRR